MPSVALQHQLRRRAAAALGAPLLRDMHRPEARGSFVSLGHIWVAIGLTFWLGAISLQLAAPLRALALCSLAAFMATRINALNVLVHEGSHRCLARSRRLNTWLCNGAAGYWILLDESGYRAVHSLHHRHLNEPSDPDRPLYLLAGNRAAIARGVLADITGWSVIRRGLVYLQKGSESNAAASSTGMRALHLAAKAGAQLCLLAVCALTLGPRHGLLLYVTLWVIPLICLFPLIIRLRVTAEHFSPELLERPEESWFVSRTTLGGPLERYLLGAKMELHFEHHLFPSVPYCQITRLHEELENVSFFDSGPPLRPEHTLSPGYLAFWRQMLRSPYFEGRDRT